MFVVCKGIFILTTLTVMSFFSQRVTCHRRLEQLAYSNVDFCSLSLFKRSLDNVNFEDILSSL